MASSRAITTYPCKKYVDPSYIVRRERDIGNPNTRPIIKIERVCAWLNINALDEFKMYNG